LWYLIKLVSVVIYFIFVSVAIVIVVVVVVEVVVAVTGEVFICVVIRWQISRWLNVCLTETSRCEKTISLDLQSQVVNVVE